MPNLFSYTLRVDDGAAPNPFSGMCSLAICKPGIRKAAAVGDWVVGLGSKKAKTGDLSGCVVYAMLVTEVVTLQEYDQLAIQRWPHRIPNVKSLALQDRLGDCVYDYSRGMPIQRAGVHGLGNMSVDLGGLNVLLSKDFYYFGSNAVKLPANLQSICHQNQGHKKDVNAPYVLQFVQWIRSLGYPIGQLMGWPGYIVDWNLAGISGGCVIRHEDDQNDIPC